MPLRDKDKMMNLQCKNGRRHLYSGTKLCGKFYNCIYISQSAQNAALCHSTILWMCCITATFNFTVATIKILISKTSILNRHFTAYLFLYNDNVLVMIQLYLINYLKMLQEVM